MTARETAWLNIVPRAMAEGLTGGRSVGVSGGLGGWLGGGGLGIGRWDFAWELEWGCGLRTVKSGHDDGGNGYNGSEEIEQNA